MSGLLNVRITVLLLVLMYHTGAVQGKYNVVFLLSSQNVDLLIIVKTLSTLQGWSQGFIRTLSCISTIAGLCFYNN